jgi:hypothetical protein
MPFEIHTVEVADLSDIQNQDRIVLYMNNAVASGASGSTTTAAVTISGLVLPSDYNVIVTPSTPCIASVSNKTNSGFTVTLTGNGTGDVAVGTLFDVVVLG